MFQPGASAYSISLGDTGAAFEFYGAGMTNNSGVQQTFENDVHPGIFGLPVGTRMFFYNDATAGEMTAFINHGGGAANIGGSFTFLSFNGTSNAGSATIINEGSPVPDGNDGGVTEFFESSSADNATIITNGSNGTIGPLANTPLTYFLDSSSAANATLIANAGVDGGMGGLIGIAAGASGGAARVELFGNGTLAIDPGARTTIGSLEGNGIVTLAEDSPSPAQLTIGGNDLSTTFSGTITNNGSIRKAGRGKLILTKGSSYTRGTIVGKGGLLVTNRSGSATGAGAVQVYGGALGGTGKIAGAVAVASTTSSGVLSPGLPHQTGVLTLASSLFLDSLATYHIDLDSGAVTADQAVANGVTIMSGARITVDDFGTGTLAPGTVFTILSNTAADTVSGTFDNLPDNSTFKVGSNTYLVSYEGGSGNDLTLTVQ